LYAYNEFMLVSGMPSITGVICTFSFVFIYVSRLVIYAKIKTNDD